MVTFQMALKATRRGMAPATAGRGMGPATTRAGVTVPIEV
jgi:hypothetical protein